MQQRFVAPFALLALLALLLAPLPAASQGRPGDPPPASPIASSAGAPSALLRERLGARSGPVPVLVELAAPPVTVAVARARAAGMAAPAAAREGQLQLARVDGAQRDLLRRVAALDGGAAPIFRVQRVLNAVAISADPGSLAAIAALPGVRALHPLPYHRRFTSASVPLIGAPAVWRGLPGLPQATGAGIKIGIVDTGIDYHHVAFGGPGTGYAANDPTTIADAPSAAYFGPGAPKVRGGYDFVGDAYNGLTMPEPDSDPMDCLDPAAETAGHGTHVAATAAGFGVTAAGARFAGPYDAPIDVAGLRIGPGVAPEAELYALRVFGCSGGTGLTIAAIEWAVDPDGDGDTADRLDVLNMSLGSDYGRPDDPTAVASDNAAQAGVIVVAAAGNAGDSYYIHGSPASSSYALSVASSDDGAQVVDGFVVTSPAATAGPKPARLASAYPWTDRPPVTGDLVYLPGAGTATGCNLPAGSPYTPGQLAGKLLLVDWAPAGSSASFCGSAERAANAAAAGAAGLIIASGQPYFDTGIIGSATLAAVFTTSVVGEALKAAPGIVRATLSGALAQTQLFVYAPDVDRVSGFSSRGARMGDGALKPDIAAPGSSIFSADFTSGSGGKALSGTSMAAPHLAGVMALLRQLRPAYSVQQLKAFVMNTAAADLSVFGDGSLPFETVQRVGVGRVDVARAAAGTAIVYNSARPELVSLSFGNLELTATTVLTQQLTVENLGAAPASYSVSFTPDSPVPGVSYTVAPGRVSVAPGARANLTVTLRADPALLRHLPDEAIGATQGANPPTPRASLAEASGTVNLHAAPPTTFFADVVGRNVVPPLLDAGTSAYASLSYDPGANRLAYELFFSGPITLAGADLRRAAAGANGPVAAALLAPGAYDSSGSYTGSTTLSEADEARLLAGELALTLRTAAHPEGELRGQVVPEQLPDLRVGVYATARPAATLAAAPAVAFFGADPAGSFDLGFTGAGVNAGPRQPLDPLSLLSVFELQARRPARVVGVLGEADLAAVGVASSFGDGTGVAGATLFFAVATEEPWASPNTVAVEIYLDTDGSGIERNGAGAEYVLFNASAGAFENQPNDAFVAILYDYARAAYSVAGPLNGLAPDAFDTQPFNSNVMALPVPAAALGLDAGRSAFTYRVRSFDVGGAGDDSGPLRYDVARPGVTVSSAALVQAPVYRALPGTRLEVAYDRARFLANRSLGLLILHHHNGGAVRAETVLINPRLYLPLVRK
jgi:subtilisin family serine protease